MSNIYYDDKERTANALEKLAGFTPIPTIHRQTDKRIADAVEKIAESGIPSGGSVTTPDWNVNDPTSPAYIKNRPFYEGDTTYEEYMPEMTAFTSAQIPGIDPPSPSDGYRLVVNGVGYETEILDDGNNVDYAFIGTSSDRAFFIFINYRSGEIANLISTLLPKIYKNGELILDYNVDIVESSTVHFDENPFIVGEIYTIKLGDKEYNTACKNEHNAFVFDIPGILMVVIQFDGQNEYYIRAMDYVKTKIIGESGEIILDEAYRPLSYFINDAVTNPSDGETYYVFINDIRYVTTATVNNEYGTIDFIDENTNHSILFFGTEAEEIVYYEFTLLPTVKIDRAIKSVYKIDQKYIPITDRVVIPLDNTSTAMTIQETYGKIKEYMTSGISVDLVCTSYVGKSFTYAQRFMICSIETDNSTGGGKIRIIGTDPDSSNLNVGVYQLEAPGAGFQPTVSKSVNS